MARLLLIMLAALAFVASASSRSTAASPQCSGSPDPVQSQPYPTDYWETITTTGAAPNTTYYIWESEKNNNQITQQHPVTFFTTDSFGNGSEPVNGNDPNHVLAPGTVQVKITLWPSGARLTTCSFTVT